MNVMTEQIFTEDEMHYSAPDKIGNEVEVAIYARSASVDKRKIENQISDCKDFIKSIGGDPEKAVIYADNGYAGSDDDRPAYRQLFRDAEEGKFQVLVIHDFPRLMRGTAKCIKVLDSLSEKHIETYISSFGIPAKELYSFPLAA